MKQLSLPGMEPIIGGLAMRFTALLRTEPGRDREVDQDTPMAEMFERAGAADIKGGYDTKLGAWTYSFLLKEETTEPPFAAVTPGSFIRNMADVWAGQGFEHDPCYLYMEVSWVDASGAVQRGVVLDNVELTRLSYEPR